MTFNFDAFGDPSDLASDGMKSSRRKINTMAESIKKEFELRLQKQRVIEARKEIERIKNNPKARIGQYNSAYG